MPHLSPAEQQAIPALAIFIATYFFLIGLRNRWSVFRSWAYTYIRFRDGVRLITGSQDLPGWDKLKDEKAPQP